VIGLRERLRLFRSIRQLNRLHCFFASQDDVLDEFRSIETSRLKLSDSTTTINKAFTGREAGGRKVARSSYPETCAFVEFHLVSRSQGSIESLWALQGLASKFKFYSSFLLPFTSLYSSTENDSVFFTWRNFQSRSFSISTLGTSRFGFLSTSLLPFYTRHPAPSLLDDDFPDKPLPSLLLRTFSQFSRSRGLSGQSQDHS